MDVFPKFSWLLCNYFEDTSATEVMTTWEIQLKIFEINVNRIPRVSEKKRSHKIKTYNHWQVLAVCTVYRDAHANTPFFLYDLFHSSYSTEWTETAGCIFHVNNTAQEQEISSSISAIEWTTFYANVNVL